MVCGDPFSRRLGPHHEQPTPGVRAALGPSGDVTQVVGINGPEAAVVTEATVFGPFFVEHAPRMEIGEDMAFEASGEPCYAPRTVRSVDVKAIPNTRIEVWEADESGFYGVQYSDGQTAARTPCCGRERPVLLLGVVPHVLSDPASRAGVVRDPL